MLRLQGPSRATVQAERLNPEKSKDYVIVQPLIERQRGSRNDYPPHKWLTSNRLIDAKICFYGTYVQLSEQVTLQNQDPKQMNLVFA